MSLLSFLKPTMALFVILALSSCSSQQISSRPIKQSDASAKVILAKAQREHGVNAFSKVRDISVGYDGKWGAVGPRFQPVLVDKGYRKLSEERLLLREGIVAQSHQGPMGKKSVLRTRSSVVVQREGVTSIDEETNQAAALVADAYEMFLLGPLYFSRAGIVLADEGLTTVNGVPCHKVLAVLRPGFGMAAEDRVILMVNAATNRLERVRMTLNGLESTQGAEVDVSFKDYRRVNGVLWPTDFDERIRVPFDLHAHHWKMTGLELNRGLEKKDVAQTGWSEKAARKAAFRHEEEPKSPSMEKR